MQVNIKFDIQLPLSVTGKMSNSIYHIKDKSCYDNNYYVLPTYGDWISYGDKNNNILFEEYDECSNYYKYSFGRFDNNEYVTVLSFASDVDVLKDVQLVEIEYSKLNNISI